MRRGLIVVALLAAPALARAEVAPLECPPGTTHERTELAYSVEEACTLPDGRRHGPWRRLDAEGHVDGTGRFVDGSKDGAWVDGAHGVREVCTFDRGREVATYDPWQWPHRRYAVTGGGGYGGGAAVGALTLQLGLDVWVEARHCVWPHRGKEMPRALAVIGDVQLLAGAAPHRARLGLQAYRSNLEEDGRADLLGGTSFASLGAIVTADREVGVAASVGLDSMLYRLELRADYVPQGDAVVTLSIGVDDYFLRR